MRKLITLLYCLCTLSLSYAQDRRAVIIGINDYYYKPGVKYDAICLKGCVNDAKLVKGMLLTRFGFKTNDISEIYNDKASRRNILSKMNQLLAASRRGDIAVIYYSGHGLLLKNSLSNKDFIQEGSQLMGHNQGILTSDIYSDTASMIRDHEFSRIANRFIDKGVVLTMIFDCCYSQSLLRGQEDGADEPWSFDEDVKEEENGRSVDERMIQLNLGSIGIDDSLVLESRNVPDQVNDLRDRARIVIPAERPNSRFLYYAASIGLDRSYERFNSSNIKHGLFTQALTDVLKVNPANTSLSVIHKKISDKLRGEQYVLPEKQNPNFQADPARANQNLLGLPVTALNDKVTVKCTRVTGNNIVVDGGASVGLSKGNILRYAKGNAVVSARVTQLLTLDTAMCEVIAGDKNLLKPGVSLVVSDWFIQSDPVMKLFIPDDSCSVEKMQAFFKEKVLPFKTSAKTIWFDKGNNNCLQFYCSGNVFYAGMAFMSNRYPIKSFGKEYAENLAGDKNIFINLPMVSSLSKLIKEKLSRNQNIVLVNSLYDADAYLYCSYSPVSDEFVFTLSNDIKQASKKGTNLHRVSDINFRVPVSDFNTAMIKKASDDIIKEVILKYAGMGLNKWLNIWPRR